ncbi:MAG: NAD(P)/FAD-dependent oxidoreductase [Nitratireductor sp.]
MDDSFDVIILGAGGAGLMCAGMAGQLGKKAMLIDHAQKVGKKILISGGGRCNFTNVNTTAKNYLSQNPHFVKSALKQYSAQNFIDLVKSYKIDFHEKTLGQLFCDGSATQIVDMLLNECDKGNVSIQLGQPIDEVKHEGETFYVSLAGKTYKANSFVVATGGPSIPKMGATDYAYTLARQFGLKIVEPKPALVPFTLAQEDALFKELSGVSAQVVTSHNKAKFQEAALFTHKGLSGPAILQISSYWKHGEPIGVNFVPSLKQGWIIEAKRNTQKLNLSKLLAKHMTERLAKALVERLKSQHNLKDRLAENSDKLLNQVELQLANWQFSPNGTEGYAKAEVTIGGVDTNELSSKTMETKKQKGLFVIGEAVDVTGWLGGYNFQWAWASGYCAAQHV